ncbi:MAG: DUF4252 domain-containing protein [Lewinellaceae bacterium]|nr:DUF4252 domain-containing protein [Lewinella sp.]MCB9279098.1 DUF4252 domain-containing protein [Lewinellaceae bacterium]
MKRITWILTLACLFLAAGAYAQKSSLRTFYDKYKDRENVIDIKISGLLVKVAASFSDDQEARHILQKISRLRLLNMENDNPVTSQEYKELTKNIQQESYEPLMQIRDKDQKVDFFIREDGDKIEEVLMFINGPDSFLMLSVQGLFKFSDLQDLHMDIEGGDQFRKIPRDRKSIPQA